MSLGIVKKVDNAVKKIPIEANLLRDGTLKLTVSCPKCRGTGLIPLKNNKTIGGLCPLCHGKAYQIISFQPWLGIQKIEGIKKVQNTFINLIPKDRKKCFRQMPYDLFLAGINLSDYVKKKK